MSAVVPPPVVPATGRQTLLSVLAGIGAAIAGGLLWGVVLGVWNFRFGAVALVVGAAVGFAMAKTATPSRGLAPVAAVLALAGCVFGEMFGDVISQARFEKIPLGEALQITATNPSLAGEIFASHFDVVGVAFWAFGAWAAFSFVRKAVAELEAQLATEAAALTTPETATETATETETAAADPVHIVDVTVATESADVSTAARPADVPAGAEPQRTPQA